MKIFKYNYYCTVWIKYIYITRICKLIRNLLKFSISNVYHLKWNLFVTFDTSFV